jgi:S-DNA-T family DNA segregation ATPase FtsK/SpoIIIE
MSSRVTSLGRTSRAPLAAPSRRREVAGILLLSLALFLGLSLVAFQLDTAALMGPLGDATASGLYALFGVAGYALSGACLWTAVRILAGRALKLSIVDLLAGAMGTLSLTILLHVAFARHRLRGHGPGGLVGEYLAELLRFFLSTPGTVLLAVTAMLAAVVVLTELTLVGLLRLTGRGTAHALGWLTAELRTFGTSAFPGWRGRAPAATPGSSPLGPTIGGSKTGASSPRTPPAANSAAPPCTSTEAGEDATIANPPGDPQWASDFDEDAPLQGDPLALWGPLDGAVPSGALASSGAAAPVIVTINAKPLPPRPMAGELPSDAERAAAEGRAPRPSARGALPDFIATAIGGYRLPPLTLLHDPATTAEPPDEAQMRELAGRLQRTLETYGVLGRVTEIHPGPVVTMYEFQPAPGTRLSKIAGLSGDLAMALEALRVRIVAPIPGKAAVGIEVPNRQRETVYLKEILGDDCFTRSRSFLTLALGKDIAGLPIVCDLAKMPHLLVAGTTGSGKSVSVNAMLCSILYASTPEQVRMIMVDPKMLELSIYDGVPHLLLPVVTDPKKANLALRWSVDEMDRRYELLSKARARDIAEYNRKVEEGKLDPPVRQRPLTEDLDESDAAVRRDKAPDKPRKLPYIIVVIDEFADLMMTAPKEVETSVMRIAQKARAAGIHLLLATQRPSVNVITGVIKANFPSRIAFQVSSKNDSRVILDQGGAENLLGAGDMLLSESGRPVRRVHGCLVTGEEINELVEFLKKQGTPAYDMEILKPRDDEEGAGGLSEDFDDEMYDQAVRIVAETRQASISMVQRRLRVGYNRAARMIERMEREGIVGPADGPNRREVLVSPL